MKKTLLLFIGLMMAQWAASQTVVVLDLPNPCENNGVEDAVLSTFDFKVFPNPADASVTLSFSDIAPIGKVEVEVSDMRGVSVMRKQYYSSFSELRTVLRLEDLAPGVYSIAVRGKEVNMVKKLIKQ